MLFWLAVLAGFNSWAQSRVVSGTVLDSTSGETLIGVTVTIKGTQQASSTDLNGKFSVSIPVNNSALVFSYVGYDPQTVIVKGETNLTVKLQSASQGLNEIVVIGYGAVKKKDLTGSVAQVNMGDLNKAPVVSFDDALGGRVAGVQVTSTEGQPGVGSAIVIRGGNSLTQDNSPLYVIDGFPIEGEANNLINPAEIASMEILKDASATAIYGARGANGVIIITTKRGKVGDPRINYNAYYGFQSITNKIPVMNPYEFVKLQTEIDPLGADTIYLKGKTLEDYRNVAGINWQDQLFRRAPMSSHNLSMSGGNAKTKYSISGSLQDQQGIIIASGYKRYQGVVSLDQDVNDKLRVGINVRYTNSRQYGTPTSAGSGTQGLLYSAWAYRPIAVNLDNLLDQLYDPSTPTLDLRINPVLTANNELRNNIVNSMIANGYAEYAITKDLKLKITGGYNNNQLRNEIFNNSKTYSGGPQAKNGPNGAIYNYQTTTWLNENTLNYIKDINKDHHIDLLAGITAQGAKLLSNGVKAVQLPNESLGLSGLDEGTPFSVLSSTSSWTLLSGLARANYAYKSKYLFTASFRADGSSRFSPENEWSYFPSTAFAWRFTEEGFMKKLGFLSDGKLRLSWGITGNNRVSDYATYSSFFFDPNGGYPFNGTVQKGAYINTLGNQDLKWETTAQTDIGLDIGFLNQRISVVADYYDKTTSNLLLNAQLPNSSGFDDAYKNIGKVSNSGFEFSLTTVNITGKKFGWTTSFNISFNRNKVLALAENQNVLLSPVTWFGSYTSAAYIAQIGQSASNMYGYLYDGVYQYSDFDKLSNGTYQLKANVPNNGNDRTTIKPGTAKYKDINNDGVVDANDQTVIGNALPKHIGGFSNNFTYKNFDLNVFFQWSYGNDIINANRYLLENGGNKPAVNQFASYSDRWSPTNQSSTIPAAGSYNSGPLVYSSRVIEDGSYLRLKTVQLGYNFSSKLLSAIKVKSLRVYASAQNLYTWTKYSGYDPEVSDRNSALTPGFDFSAYPRARTIILGLNINL